MDDLIRREDAMQSFLDEVKQSRKDHIHINTIKRLLDDVDVAYDVDRVVEQIEAYPFGNYGVQEMNEIMDIVKAGGVNG